MKPENVTSIYVSGNKLENLLFECALNWAEKGHTVWFITPTKITNLPILWQNPPNKEVLKLIIIMYITNRKDLLTKFNEIHLWNKLPKVIIFLELETFISNSDNDVAAFLLASILDGIKTCSIKLDAPTCLVTSCSLNMERNIILKNIVDLYFTYYLNEDIQAKEIVEIFDK